MAALDNLLQLFAQRSLRQVAGQQGQAPDPRAAPPTPRGAAPSGIASYMRDPGRAAALGAGVRLLQGAGQPGAVGNALEGALQAAQAAQMAQQQAQLDEARNNILQQYAGKDDIPSMQSLALELISLGDEQSLGMVQQLTPLIRAMGGDEPFRVVQGVPLGPDGQPVPGAANQYMMVGPDGQPKPTGVGVSRTDPETMTSAIQLQQNYLRNVTPIMGQLRVLDEAIPMVSLAANGNTAAQSQVLAAFVEAMTANPVAARPGMLEFVNKGRPYLEQAQTWLGRVQGRGEVAPAQLINEIGPILSRAQANLRKDMTLYHDSALRFAREYNMPENLFILPGQGQVGTGNGNRQPAGTRPPIEQFDPMRQRP